MEAPTVGRVVHYVNERGTHCAAIITGVGVNNHCALHVFSSHLDDEASYRRAAEYDEAKMHDSWHWPERN
jgi:hypothetical protein